MKTINVSSHQAVLTLVKVKMLLACFVLLASSLTPKPASAAWALPWEAGELQQQAAMEHANANMYKQRVKQVIAEVQKAKSRTHHVVLSGLVTALFAGGIIYYLLKNRSIVHQVIKNVIVKKEVIVRSPAHELVPDTVLIDGTNVLYANPNPNPSLLNLLGLLLELQKRGTKFKCIFDASTYYALKNFADQNHALVYSRLCSEYLDTFYSVPAGNQADDYLLDDAHRYGYPIISNDRFQDYTEKYEWLTNGSKRRVCFSIHCGIIQIVPLGIQASIPTDLEMALTTLRAGLGEPKSQPVPRVPKKIRVKFAAPIHVNGQEVKHAA